MRTGRNSFCFAARLVTLFAIPFLGFACGDDEGTTRGTPGVSTRNAVRLETTEAGGQTTFQVVLDAMPTADVTIAVSSDDPGEGTVTPASLVFTSTNWEAPQTITVTGQDDSLTDGNVTYNVVLSSPTSDDAEYAALAEQTVEVENIDNETAGITVGVAANLETTEAGGSAMFTVVLNSEPSADVTVALASGDEGEVTLSATSLTFTSANWDAPQEVTVTGVDDSVADGNVMVTITVGPSASTDTDYEGLNGDDVTVSNEDNDTADVLVTAADPIVTSEDPLAPSATFTVVLTSAPQAGATVQIPVVSGNTDEGTVSPATLEFTPDNWDAAQTVTVTGVDDPDVDGDQLYQVLLNRVTSDDDDDYDGIDPPDVNAQNLDNDTPGFRVNTSTTGNTTEDGGQTTFTVAVVTRPSAPVTVAVSSSNTAEGTVTPASLVFNSDNWASPQTVTVTGQDDVEVDGDQMYNVILAQAVSTDTDYDELDPEDVALQNTDNDSAGFLLSRTSGLVTTEAGDEDTFEIRLLTEPDDDVTIDLSSDKPDEGDIVGPTTLTFTPMNWDANQTVRVRGVGDTVFDGDQAYTIVTSPAMSAGDTDYDNLAVPDVTAINEDNDPGVVVSHGPLVTTEAGGEVQVGVRLNTMPSGNVSVSFTSQVPGEATLNGGTSVMFTFTTANWNALQFITVKGVDDEVADGDRPFTIVTGNTVGSGGYDNLVVDDLMGTNLDNDSPGVQVTPTSGLLTREDGTSTGNDEFEVVLLSSPAMGQMVTISVTIAGDEVSASTGSLVFTDANWDAPQTVNLTGLDDASADGNQSFTVTLAIDGGGTTDAGYATVDVADPTGTNQDNETAGFDIEPTGTLDTREDGSLTPQFRMRLTSQPMEDVTIGLMTGDSTEGTVLPSEFTFTDTNWNAFQTAVVTGVDDEIADGNQLYEIITVADDSTGADYEDLDPDNISMRNQDDDVAGVLVTPLDGLETTEAGGTDTFEVRLNSQPTANVTIDVSSQDTTEVRVTSGGTLTFTPANWNAAQEVTLTGQDDAVADGNQVVNVLVEAAASTDSAYNGLSAVDPTVEVDNRDNETAGIIVTADPPLETTEAGGDDTFTIVLNSEPLVDVIIPLSVSDTSEGSVDPISVTFTPANWNSPQTVRAIGVDDPDVDGDQSYTVVTGPAAASGDANYNMLDADDVAAENGDDETAGLTVEPLSGLRTAEDMSLMPEFTVVLDSRPTTDVMVALTSSNIMEGTVSPASLTFTRDNWNAPQAVTLTGVQDTVADGNQAWQITVDPSSGDADYNALPNATVDAVNEDDETAGVRLSRTSGLITREDGLMDTFTVRLTSAPAGGATVTVPIASDDTGEGTVSPAMFMFDATNWNMEQTVTVTGVDDAPADGNATYNIEVGPTSSTIGGDEYDGLAQQLVAATNFDNDSPGIVVNPTGTTLFTSETGTTEMFTVVLTSEPQAGTEVRIVFTGVPSDEGMLDNTMLTFTPSGGTAWNIAQTVTITGVDDAGLQDGDQPYTITGSPATSTDTDYAALSSFTVDVINRDDDG